MAIDTPNGGSGDEDKPQQREAESAENEDRQIYTAQLLVLAKAGYAYLWTVHKADSPFVREGGLARLSSDKFRKIENPLSGEIEIWGKDIGPETGEFQDHAEFAYDLLRGAVIAPTEGGLNFYKGGKIRPGVEPAKFDEGDGQFRIYNPNPRVRSFEIYGPIDVVNSYMFSLEISCHNTTFNNWYGNNPGYSDGRFLFQTMAERSLENRARKAQIAEVEAKVLSEARKLQEQGVPFNVEVHIRTANAVDYSFHIKDKSALPKLEPSIHKDKATRPVDVQGAGRANFFAELGIGARALATLDKIAGGFSDKGGDQSESPRPKAEAPAGLPQKTRAPQPELQPREPEIAPGSENVAEYLNRKLAEFSVNLDPEQTIDLRSVGGSTPAEKLATVKKSGEDWDFIGYLGIRNGGVKEESDEKDYANKCRILGNTNKNYLKVVLVESREETAKRGKPTVNRFNLYRVIKKRA